MDVVTLQSAEDCRKLIFYYIVHLEQGEGEGEGEERPFWADSVLDYWHVDRLKQRQILMYGHKALPLEDEGNLHKIMLREVTSNTKLRSPLPEYKKFVDDACTGGITCTTLLQTLFIGDLWEPAVRAAANTGVFRNVKPFLAWAGGTEKSSTRLPGLFLVSFWLSARVAAENGHSDLVLALLNLRFSLNPDEYSTILPNEIREVVSPWMYIVWRFIVSSCNIDFSPSEFLHNYGGFEIEDVAKGWTFLHFAAMWGDVECTRRLLGDASFEVDVVSVSEGLTPLHLAAFHGHVGVVNLLLDLNANVNVQDEEVKRTPLYYACARNHVSVVKEILLARKEEVHVDAMDVYGMTALHMAAFWGNIELIKELLRYSLHPNMTIREDQLRRRLFVGDYLRRSSRKVMKRFEHIVRSNLAFMWEKLPISFDLDPMFLMRPNRLESTIWSPAGFTMLHFAIVYGGLTPATILDLSEQDKRIDVTVKDNRGLTCMDWAIINQIHQGAINEDSGNTHTSSLNSRMAATVYHEEIKEANREKERLAWALELGAALLSNNREESRRLVLVAVKNCIQIDLDIWDHLEWVFDFVFCYIPKSRKLWKVERGLYVIRTGLCGLRWFPQLDWQQRTWNMRKRGAVMESLLVKLVEGRAFSQSKLAEQRCLMWAIRCDMIQLTEAFTATSNSGLLVTPYNAFLYQSPLRFRHESPLDFAERTRPALAKVMAEKDEVKEHVRVRRQEFLYHLNTIVVVAALIAGFSAQKWIQSPIQTWKFQLCNGFGFFISMATVLAGITGSSPVQSPFLAKKWTRIATAHSINLLAVAIAFEVAAFVIIAMHESSPRIRAPLVIIGLLFVIFYLTVFRLLSNVNWSTP